MNEFDKHASSYSEMLDHSLAPIGGFNEYYTQRKVDYVSASMRGAPVACILDFGCGIGATAGMLQRAFPSASVSGADVSAVSIEEAARRSPAQDFHVLDADFVDLSRGRYDMVYIANVLHHVPLQRRRDVMRMVARVMSPGGRLFLFEHNPANPLTRWVVSRCEFDEDAVLLHSSECRALARSAGLACSRTGYLLFFPPALRRLAPLESPLGWLPFGAQYCVEARKAT